MIHIRRFEAKDFNQYIRLCQRVFEDTYTKGSVVPASLFCIENFLDPPMEIHFRGITQNNHQNSAWVAEKGGKIVGAISVTYHSKCDEVRGYYVDVPLQGQGIGTQLWEAMLSERRNQKIIVDVFTHARKTIQMYRRRGFKQQIIRRRYCIQWDNWPEGYILTTTRLYKKYA